MTRTVLTAVLEHVTSRPGTVTHVTQDVGATHVAIIVVIVHHVTQKLDVLSAIKDTMDQSVGHVGFSVHRVTSGRDVRRVRKDIMGLHAADVVMQNVNKDVGNDTDGVMHVMTDITVPCVVHPVVKDV